MSADARNAEAANAGGRKQAGVLSRGLSTAFTALGRGLLALLRGLGKVLITIWRLTAALDSALWRAVKLLARKTVRGLAYGLRLAGAAFHSLLLWLPTRTGRAYSAVSGVVLIIAGLWIVDELRAGPALEAGAGAMRAPVDERDPILARIGGRYVHLSEIEASARAEGFLRPDETLTPEAAFRRELVEAYVEQRLLANAALDEGFQRDPGVSRKVNAARDRVLASAFMNARLDEAVTDDAVRRFYDSQAGVTALGDEVRARHIVVASEEEAQEIVALLEGGADFGGLARERSIDRATAPLRGEIGWFTRAMMTPAFSRAAFAAEPGSLAPPFETEFGWHILEVTDRRSTSSVPFADVRDKVETFIRMRTIETTLRDLEEASQVVYFPPEAEEKPSPPAPVMPASQASTEEAAAGDAAADETAAEGPAGEETLR